MTSSPCKECLSNTSDQRIDVVGVESLQVAMFSKDLLPQHLSEEGPRGVSFSFVHVREYERVLGDHPGARSGPPISIGWAFVQHEPQPVGTYETKRRKNGVVPLMPGSRRILLRDVYDYTEAELRKAEMDACHVSYRRRQTAIMCGSFEEKCAELGEKVQRKVKKVIRNLTFRQQKQALLVSSPGMKSSAMISRKQ